MLPIFGILTSPQHQNLLIQIWLFNASRKRKGTTLSKSRLCNITRVHCWSRPIIWPLKQWLRQGKSFIKRKNKKTKLKQLTPCKALWCIPTFLSYIKALYMAFFFLFYCCPVTPFWYYRSRIAPIARIFLLMQCALAPRRWRKWRILWALHAHFAISSLLRPGTLLHNLC